MKVIDAAFFISSIAIDFTGKNHFLKIDAALLDFTKKFRYGDFGKSKSKYIQFHGKSEFSLLFPSSSYMINLINDKTND